MDQDFHEDLVIVEKHVPTEDQPSLIAAKPEVSAQTPFLPRPSGIDAQIDNKSAVETNVQSKPSEPALPAGKNPYLRCRPTESLAKSGPLPPIPSSPQPPMSDGTPVQSFPPPQNSGIIIPSWHPPLPPHPRTLNCNNGCSISFGYGQLPPPPPPPLDSTSIKPRVQANHLGNCVFRPAQQAPPPPPPPPLFPSSANKKTFPPFGVHSNERRARSRSRSRSWERSGSTSSQRYGSRSRSSSPERNRTLDVYNAGALLKCFHGMTDRTVKLQPYRQQAYVIKANFTKTDMKKWFPLLKYAAEERWYAFPSRDTISALENGKLGCCDDDCSYPCCSGVLNPIHCPTFNACDEPQIHIGAALHDLSADRPPFCTCKRPSRRWNENRLEICRCVSDATAALKKKDITWYSVIAVPQGKVKGSHYPPAPSQFGKCNHCGDGGDMVRKPTEGERIFQVIKSGSRSDAAAKVFYEAAIHGASIMFTCAVSGDVANWDTDELTDADGPKTVDSFWEFAKIPGDAFYFGHGWKPLTSSVDDW